MYDPDFGRLAAKILLFTGWALVLLGAVGVIAAFSEYDETYLALSFGCTISGLLIWAVSVAVNSLLNIAIASKKHLELATQRADREVGMTIGTKNGYDISIDRDGKVKVDRHSFLTVARAKEWAGQQEAS
jgi:hypothetical protein